MITKQKCVDHDNNMTENHSFECKQLHEEFHSIMKVAQDAA